MTEIERPAAEIVAGLTVRTREGDLISDVMILAKVIPADSSESVALSISSDDSLDWIAQRGLVSAAQAVLDDHAEGESYP
jgi:hypothetical protein